MKPEQQTPAPLYEKRIADLEAIMERVHLTRDEQDALAFSARLLGAIARNPVAATSLLSILESQDQEKRLAFNRRHAAVIWGRVDKTMHAAVKTTYDLGRVSQEVIDAATQLAQCTQEALPLMADPSTAQQSLDRIEGVSHQLRAATRVLTGRTMSVMKVDHDRLESVLRQWKPIDGAPALLLRFQDLGLAWEPVFEATQAPSVQSLRMSRSRA